MSLLKRFGRRLLAISAIASTACSAAPATELDGSQPRPLEGRRSRHDHLPVRDDPSPPQGYEVAKLRLRQGGGGRRHSGRGNGNRRKQSRGDDERVATAGSEPGTSADRRPRSARKTGRPPGNHRQVRHPGADVRQDGNLGCRLHAAWRPVQGTWAGSGVGRRIRAEEAIHRKQKVDRTAGNECRAAGLLRPIVGRGAAEVPDRHAGWSR